MNFILQTDSYKLSHHGQYPKNVTKIVSYLESRGGLYPSTVFYGLLGMLIKHFEGVRVTPEDVEEAKQFALKHFGSDIFNYDGWMYIAKELGGKLPIKIKAVKEGSVVPVSNVLMTIENTDPECPWLTNHCETILMRLWAPITIATNSFYCKRVIKDYLEETTENCNNLPFKLHDFGYRGVSSEETAGILGSAHLTSFLGTDTLAGIVYANKYYNQNLSDAMYGFSVPASEHSVACTYGVTKEDKYFLNMLNIYPTGIVSIVSDTYNVYNFVETMSTEYKQKILERDGKVVFRPDSGDPIEVNSRLIDILWRIFGGTYYNGYKLLPPQVGIIQGDGIDHDMLDKILAMGKAKGYSADNWIFGSGGGLLQKFDRDTQKFAIKACYGEKEEEFFASPESLEPGIRTIGFDIYKQPITDKGKNSKKGKLKLHRAGKDYSTIESSKAGDMFEGYVDELEVVFKNGEIKRRQSFDEIRNRILTFL